MPLRLALGVRGTVARHRLGALEGGGGACPASNASLPPPTTTGMGTHTPRRMGHTARTPSIEVLPGLLPGRHIGGGGRTGALQYRLGHAPVQMRRGRVARVIRAHDRSPPQRNKAGGRRGQHGGHPHCAALPPPPQHLRSPPRIPNPREEQSPNAPPTERWAMARVHRRRAVQSAGPNVARRWAYQTRGTVLSQRGRHGDARGQSTERTKAEAVQRTAHDGREANKPPTRPSITEFTRAWKHSPPPQPPPVPWGPGPHHHRSLCTQRPTFLQRLLLRFGASDAPPPCPSREDGHGGGGGMVSEGVRAPCQVFEQLPQQMVHQERGCRWHLVGSEAVPFPLVGSQWLLLYPGGPWMVTVISGRALDGCCYCWYFFL